MVRRRSFAPAGYPAIGEATYAAFREALLGSDCSLCPLHARRTRIVADRGDPKARVLLVGEAPGAEEDRAGLAFVGRSGRLLDAVLDEAGMDPGRDVLIANVVKCRPPGNRPPAAAEAEACLPFLRRQIELVAPRVLVLLGATAAKHLLPGESGGLTSRAGKLFRRPGYPAADLLITFHPAYALRNPRRRPDMVRHLALVARRLADLVREGIPYN